MKKQVLAAIALITFVAAISASCHRHGSCPAYGKVEVEKVEQNLTK